MSHEKIHFVGVGGVGMGTFATALSRYGYSVSGSDGAVYEPMKSVLAAAQIEVFEGFRADVVNRVDPDVVVIGNVVTKENPEARAWIQSGKRFLSFPEAVRQYLIGNKKSIVCSGTHGKTTTTSWVAYLLSQLKMDPSYLIGGVPRDLPFGCELSDGNYFVGEGDEYDSAFFDKGPKFLHYNPHVLILSNIEFDHADIYRDLEHVKSSFEKLIALLPGDGLCVAYYDDPVVMETVWGSLCPVQTYGQGPGAMWRLQNVKEDRDGYHFEVVYKNTSVGSFTSPMFGHHNLLNLLSGIVTAVNLGVSLDAIRPIVAKFNGARRRQELLVTEPCILVDDFAHHPTEVAATLRAVRRRFPEGRLWAFFEPRSASSRRRTHQKAYGEAFGDADKILIAAPFRGKSHVPSAEEFSPQELAAALTDHGKTAEAFETVDEMVASFEKEGKPGDIIVTMSNGEFGKIQGSLRKVVEKLT